MRMYLFLFFACVCILFTSCKENAKNRDARKIVTEWIGKEILFPDEVPCQLLGKDTSCINVNNQTYKIVAYTDSTGCSSCRLKLAIWKKLIAEADSLFPGTTDFLFFFQPKINDVKELMYLFKRDNFEYPVFIDMNNQINQLNDFSSQMEYQCFLLDQNNKVVLIGNPALNPKIWELYKQQITGGKETKQEKLTTIQAENRLVQIEGMLVGKTYTCTFEVENTGDYPFIILDIKSSCGCTVPVWNKQPVAPDGKTEIKVEVKPESTGFFNKTIQVYGNATDSPLKLSIIGSVI